MRQVIVCVIALLAGAGPAQAQLNLFARYDWQNGTTDVSGSPIRHDGVFTSVIDGYQATVDNGLLSFNGYGSVSLGQVPELDGATQFHFRFEDLTYSAFSLYPNPASNYTVLLGDEMNWWASVFFNLLPGQRRTTIELNIGGFSAVPSKLTVVVADDIISHFDSIDYRFDSFAPLDQRFAIRWNDGPWVVGGEGDDERVCLPTTSRVWFNNGGPSDWDDPIFATLGPVSLSSNIVVPEPTSLSLLLLAAMGALLRTRRQARD